VLQAISCPLFRVRSSQFCLARCNTHRKKRFMSFPSPAGMSQTKLPLSRNNAVMTSLFPPSESLVVKSRLGTGNSQTFFYGAVHGHWSAQAPFSMQPLSCTIPLKGKKSEMFFNRSNLSRIFKKIMIYNFLYFGV
jgi:hypothetical protein